MIRPREPLRNPWQAARAISHINKHVVSNLYPVSKLSTYLYKQNKNNASSRKCTFNPLQSDTCSQGQSLLSFKLVYAKFFPRTWNYLLNKKQTSPTHAKLQPMPLNAKLSYLLTGTSSSFFFSRIVEIWTTPNKREPKII